MVDVFTHDEKFFVGLGSLAALVRVEAALEVGRVVLRALLELIELIETVIARWERVQQRGDSPTPSKMKF